MQWNQLLFDYWKLLFPVALRRLKLVIKLTSFSITFASHCEFIISDTIKVSFGYLLIYLLAVRFPRVTLCDFRVRRLANVQRYTVQCVLPINLFNEKIFLFVWFWMASVAALTTLSLCTWSVRVAFRVDRYHYVRHHLRLVGHLRDDSKTDAGGRQLRGFVDHYLQPDGVFVLRLIGHNTNGLTVTELLSSLWDNYRHMGVTSDPESPDPTVPSNEKAQRSNDI